MCKIESLRSSMFLVHNGFSNFVLVQVLGVNGRKARWQDGEALSYGRTVDSTIGSEGMKMRDTSLADRLAF